MRSQVVRVACLALGLVIGVYGAWSLLRLGLSNLVSSVTWLLGVVVVHDFVLAPLALGLLAIGLRFPWWSRGPLVAGVVVLGSLTLLAIPVLGRFGAKPDNPSLLDRSYGTGWLVLAAFVSAGVLVTCLVTRRAEGEPATEDHG